MGTWSGVKDFMSLPISQIGGFSRSSIGILKSLFVNIAY
jgi:hypothetical protein